MAGGNELAELELRYDEERDDIAIDAALAAAPVSVDRTVATEVDR